MQVNIGRTLDHLLRYDGTTQPDTTHAGLNFVVETNTWGTAFPQWYSDDGLARFVFEAVNK